MADPKSGETDDLTLDAKSPAHGQPGEPAFDASATADSSPTVDTSPQTTSYFAPNDLIAGRFRVLRFIARGGMGEVYEAEDTELRDHVALKTARVEFMSDPHSSERFRREIQLARKVTHPNVCRTFDLFRHAESGPDGRTRETMVVSMELLAGETLEQRIRRIGRFSTAEALPIVEQMAAGLSAAHQVGVVHRDFKSSNVMLIAAGLGSGGARAVVTDFGLAHADAFSGHTITGAHDLVGTPAYMAPEQLQGGEVTPATDIYALGIVMYQMLTGTLPFEGSTGLSAALKRLHEPAPSPRKILPDLDAKWEQAVLRCLERDPSVRFTSAQDVVSALRGEIPAAAPVRRGWRSHPRWIYAGVGLILLVASGILQYRFQVASKARPSIAVLGFRNLSGREELNPLGIELAENLGSQLDTDRIRFINSGTVDEMKHNLGWAEVPESLTPANLAKVRDYLGCDVVAFGSYTATGDAAHRQIVWNIHLQRTKDGESLGTIPENMADSDRLEATRRAGQLVRAKLGVELASTEENRLNAALSANGDAVKYYAQGRQKLANYDVSAAAKLFEQAVEADPNYAEAHSALADAWSVLGYDSRALDEAKRAFDLSGGLSKDTGGLVKARYHEISHDWSKASTLYSSLWTLDSDTPQYGLLLARSQISGGEAQAALLTLAELGKRKLPSGIAAQRDLTEADAHESLSNFRQEFDSASSAAAKAKTLGAKLLLARAQILECLALLNLGELAQSKSACQQAQDFNRALGDQLGIARAANAMANAFVIKSDFSSALPLYEQALQTSRSIGDKLDESGALTNIGNIRLTRGDRAGAAKAYEESIAVNQERGDKRELALAQQNLAGVRYSQGDRNGAADLYQRAFQLASEIGDKDTEARALNNLCMMQSDGGELGKAEKSCEDSLKLRREIGNKSGIARTLYNLGFVQAARGDLAAAEQSYSEGLSLQQGLGEKDSVAYSQAALAALAVRQEQGASSRGAAESAANELAAEKDPSGEAQARVALAEILLQSGDVPGARTQAEQAFKLAQQADDKNLQILATIARAKADARSGNSSQAATALFAAQKDAKTAGLVGTEFEVRLTLGEIELKSGKTAAGRARLQALAQEAKQKGFGYIAARAAKAA